jgi:hypothetical protein
MSFFGVMAFSSFILMSPSVLLPGCLHRNRLGLPGGFHAAARGKRRPSENFLSVPCWGVQRAQLVCLVADPLCGLRFPRVALGSG